MKRNFAVIAAVAVALLLASSVFAHHGTAAYDTSKVVTVKGTITKFDFANPHCEVFWTVKNESGQMEQWQGELTAPNKLARAGWSKDTLKPGDAVTVSGYRTKSSTTTLWIRKLIGPDGNELPLFENE